jgi:uncharacterized protein
MWRKLAARNAKARKRKRETKPAEPPAPGQRPVKRLQGRPRKARSAGSRAVANAVIGGKRRLAAYKFITGPRRVRITQFEFQLPGLPPELDGLRIVQLSDLHHGPWMPVSFVREIIAKANEFEADIVALTGDYVTNSSRYVKPGIEVLSELRARIGLVAVLGNHDWWEGVDLIRKEFKRIGVPLIDNSRLFISTNRRIVNRCRRGLCIAGVGDQWEDAVDIDKALQGVPEDMPRLLLSHNPDVAEDERLCVGKYRIDLMLAGHLHGGQVKLPIIGSPMLPSRMKKKYAGGLVAGPTCPVFISRGIGTSGVPVRYGCPPEIVVVDLRQADN